MSVIKNIVTISLMVFLVLVTVVLGAAVFLSQSQNNQQINIPPITNSSPVSNPPRIASTGITAIQVARHNNYNDCWMIISGKIYDLTSYLSVHPGGAQSIISYCGKDGTVAFNTKGGRGSHSQYAQSLLVNYYVGNLSR